MNKFVQVADRKQTNKLAAFYFCYFVSSSNCVNMQSRGIHLFELTNGVVCICICNGYFRYVYFRKCSFTNRINAYVGIGRQAPQYQQKKCEKTQCHFNEIILSKNGTTRPGSPDSGKKTLFLPALAYGSEKKSRKFHN